MARSSAVRRRLRLARGAALLALLSVLGAAWGSAVSLNYGSQTTEWQGIGLSGAEWWHLSRNDVFGGVRYTSTVMIRGLEYKDKGDRVSLPGWATLPQPPVLGKWPNDHYEIAEGRGWPWPCLSYRFSAQGRATVRTGAVSGGFALQPWKTGAWYSPRVLPYTPIWSGIAADFAIHFIVWFAMLALIVEGRRALRRRSHQCPNCGYALHGASHAQCPECGEAAELR